METVALATLGVVIWGGVLAWQIRRLRDEARRKRWKPGGDAGRADVIGGPPVDGAAGHAPHAHSGSFPGAA
jgi:hypothetical protein